MFTKPTVTSTAVIAGKLRLRFRGLFQKVHAVQAVSTQAAPSQPTYDVPTTPRLVQSVFLHSNDKAAATSVFPSTPRRPQPSSNSSNVEELAFVSHFKDDDGLSGDEFCDISESMDPLEAEFWFACDGAGHRDVRPSEVFVDGGLDVDECEELGYRGMEGLVCGTLRFGLLWPSKN